MIALPFPSVVTAGLSIQPTRLQLVQLKKTRKTYVLKRRLEYALAPDIVSEGKITSFSSLTECLREMVVTNELQGMNTVVCVPANQVRMQRIRVPASLTEDDIEAEIGMQVYRALPGKTDPLAIDFNIRKADDAQDVFYVAARKEYIEKIFNCVRASGLRLIKIEVDVFALLRAVAHSLKSVVTDEENICAVYMNDHYAVMAAWCGRELLFHHQWDGGNSSAQAMNCMQWFNWCCHNYQQYKVKNAALGGKRELIYQAVKVISKYWNCKIYEPDPFQKIKQTHDLCSVAADYYPSNFLLAFGLALRGKQDEY